jgi:hypothetical protein
MMHAQFFQMHFFKQKMVRFFKKNFICFKTKGKKAKNYLDVTSDETIERITDIKLFIFVFKVLN